MGIRPGQHVDPVRQAAGWENTPGLALVNQRLMEKEKPRGTLVMSRISSLSASLNAVPSECEVYLDRRTVPGETETETRAEMDEIIQGKKAIWEVGTLHRTSWIR